MPLRKLAVLALALAVTVTSCFAACPPLGPSDAEPHRMPNNSMAPTLLAGDLLLARPLTGPPKRHQIVVFETERGSYVKRVVGLPGDTVSMRAGLLSVNGMVVEEPYDIPEDVVSADFAWQRKFLVAARPARRYRPTLNSWGPIVVPRGQSFVLGDNRGRSADSRYIGFVPLEAIIQEPTVIYFSRDPESGSIRWNRVGLPLSDKK